VGEIRDNLLILLWKELMEIYTAFKSPCGGKREDGDRRGEKD
jgi:hypothetical protein